MSSHRRSSSVVLVYQRDGFPLMGGIRRVAERIAQELLQRGIRVYTLQLKDAAGNQRGLLPGTWQCSWPGPEHTVIVLGCDKPLAYALVIWRRLRRPSCPAAWLPSFHDPSTARHPQRARLAGLTLRLLQRIGVVVFVQTEHELNLLDAGHCRLSSHSLAPRLRSELLAPAALRSSSRDIHLAFLGRPTEQKGWQRFLRLVEQCGLRSVALLPTSPDGMDPVPSNLEIVVGANDSAIRLWLRRTRLLMLPARYESLGLAQLEALAEGCLVPVLGHWPFFPVQSELSWQSLDLEELSERCRAICQNDTLRVQLVTQQREAILALPHWDHQFLPGLIPCPSCATGD